MNFGNVKTIDQMVEEVIENKMFDDECDELEYKWGYQKGAHQALEKVKEFINGYGDINASQGIIIDQINGFIDALEGVSNGE